jgi:hypothetical protein
MGRTPLLAWSVDAHHEAVRKVTNGHDRFG